MGWFSEQIRQRKQADDEAFADSLENIAEAVMGHRISSALSDNREVATDAIEEILRYYHVKPQEVPETILDVHEVLDYLMHPYGIMRRMVRLDKGCRLFSSIIISPTHPPARWAHRVRP